MADWLLRYHLCIIVQSAYHAAIEKINSPGTNPGKVRPLIRGLPEITYSRSSQSWAPEADRRRVFSGNTIYSLLLCPRKAEDSKVFFASSK